MRKYEAMALAKSNLSDADVQQIADRYKAVIEERGGTVSRAEKWETRKLAYAIGEVREAHYIIFNFESGADAPAELGRQLRISDKILRHRIFRMDD